MFKLRHVFLCCLVAATGAFALEPPSSPEVHDVQDLRHRVSDFVLASLGPQPAGTRLFVEPGALDARLRLARCRAPEAFLPPGSKPGARFTVGVRCTAPAWSVYLPTTVEAELPVLVLRQPAARGATLTVADVEKQVRRVPGFATLYLGDVAQLAGRHLRQPAPPGTALSTELLVPDVLIRRGQRVTLIASTGGFEVRAQGEAVADAGPTGRVRVQNLSSLKVVEGQAESADTVRVGP